MTDDFEVKCNRAFELLAEETDAVLIVPPFASLGCPPLGVHLLQAAAERSGLRVRILYTNLLFAIVCGQELYNTVCALSNGGKLGERIFASTAFGLPPLGLRSENLREIIANARQSNECEVTFEELAALEREAGPFCAALGQRFAGLRFRVAGASTSYQQTAASVALLAQVKRAKPSAVTVIGGANCEGEMAQGIASLGAPIDYIFSGECESVFPAFLRCAVAGQSLPAECIVHGEPCFNLDSLPEPSFEDYFAQLDNALPAWREKLDVWLPYESSRGCWWGVRQHCTFCGLNGETMAFREKSPERLIAGARRLLLRYPVQQLRMIDNIIPYSYFRTVLPRLAQELPPARIFWETKSNLNLEKVQLLVSAGVRIQPGIEALSSSLLRRMKKGVLARQNVALLRYARASGMQVIWNLLSEFPGDYWEDYQETLALIPLIHHLSPPTGVYAVSIDRFSPYFNDPSAFAIRHLEPEENYAGTFPPCADLHRLAYQFTGDFDCAQASHPELSDLLRSAFRKWRDCWKQGQRPPALNLAPGGDGYYTLMDTRGLEGTEMFQFLNEEEARTVLIGGPIERQPLADWAIKRKLAVAVDDWCVPLATTEVETWRRFEARISRTVPEALPVSFLGNTREEANRKTRPSQP